VSETRGLLARLGRLRNDQFSGLMLLALAVFTGWQNRAYPLGSLQEPGPGYTPLLISVFLGLVGFLIALRGRASAPMRETPWPEAKRAVVILLACGIATYALEPVGYRVTIAALLVFFLGVVERKQPWIVATVALGFSLLSYYFIGTLLRVPLPRGPFGW
jgi:hypothetical protein